MTYSVVILGAGKIAGGFDAPGSADIVTHLHGIHLDPRFQCTALFDIDKEQAKEQAKKWGVPVANSLKEAFSTPVDMVVIATPDPTHGDYLEQLLDYDIRLVLCEKPLTPSVEETRRIVNRYQQAGRALAVNYQRRFEGSVQTLKTAIGSGELGRPLGGIFWYSKGVLHNGSHAVDLLRYLFGDVREAMARRKVMDFTDADPSIAGTLRFADLDVELNIADERLYSLFELDLLFEKARYRYTMGGMRLERYEVLPDPVFPGYQELQIAAQGETGLNRVMADIYRSFGDYLDKGGELPGAAANVLGTQIVCEGLLQQPFNEWFTPGS